jgi:hypothetical protein
MLQRNLLYTGVTAQAACGVGWAEESRRYRGAQRRGAAALVETIMLAEEY